MTLRRSGNIAVVVLAVVVLGACAPLLHPVVPFIPAPAGATLSVPTSTVVRGGTVEVSHTGCDDDFQFIEVRLVSGVGENRQSTAVASGWAGEPTILTVPSWTPSGPATVEASCLEPNLSRATDGSDVHRYDFGPVPVTVAPYPQRETSRRMRVTDAVDGVLRISGTGCGDRVMVAVARGPWKVASSAEFHYGRTILTADQDGNWAGEIPLRYSVSEWNDPVAPGTMTAFAVCDGEWYPAVSFEATSTAPAVELVGGGPSLLYLSQCPVENQIGIIGVVELAGGVETYVVHTTSGTGYGESFIDVPVPVGAVAVTWYAACRGEYAPSFGYEPAHWAV